MKYLNKIFCKQCAANFINRLYKGWVLAIHIDTRAVEFMSGILAIVTGIFLTIPPNLVIFTVSSEYWAWVYAVYGVCISIASTYGNWTPRKYLSLFGVFLWTNLTAWIISTHGIVIEDDIIIASIPYSFITISSIWTYFGLWRYNIKGSQYYDRSRDT